MAALKVLKNLTVNHLPLEGSLAVKTERRTTKKNARAHHMIPSGSQFAVNIKLKLSNIICYSCQTLR